MSPACRLLVLLLAVLLLGVLAGCGDTTETNRTEAAADDRPLPNPDRNAYFGDLHVHTRHSFDAYIFTVRETPDASYRFAKGEPIQHPNGETMQLKSGPLDFQAVTDHGMYIGVLPAMYAEGSEFYDTSQAQELRSLDASLGFQRAVEMIIGGELTEFHGKGPSRDAWQDIIAAAEKHNEPGKFTTFVGYEYTTSSDDRGNLHRNVIFRGSDIPELPFSSVDSRDPEDLWDWMDRQRAEGIEALAIPHNPNGSNGQMFRLETLSGEPLSAEYAEQRMRNEPLVEITQVKGTSDTHPLLSPNDEWGEFEIMPYRIATQLYSEPKGSYVREAYLNGLLLEETQGFNPFRFGLIGSTDTHNAGPTPEEDNYFSKVGMRDGSPQRRGSVPLDEPNEDGSPRYADTYFHVWSASGLAAVWSEENTRDSIYDAFRRKETFATTGPRMRVRFFGGYELEDSILEDAEMVSRAYASAVTMGSDLIAEGDAAPSFLVWASRDPLSAPLQRVQVIKGWVEGGAVQERVFDAVCSDGLTPDAETGLCADNGADVDLSDCSYPTDLGAAELKAIWSDPTFDASQRAVYYVRVLENPTCRWSTWEALRAGVAPREGLAETIQERAWSSPIWYVPSQ